MRQYLSFLFLTFVLAACTVVGGPVKDPTAIPPRLRTNTAALVLPSHDDVDAHVYCTAVWVSKTRLITAGHCAEDSEEAHYFVPQEAQEPHEEPFAMHLAKVVKVDAKHDLALLAALGPVPDHTIAPVAKHMPDIGYPLDIVGHPSGMLWTLTRGFVSSYRGGSFGPEGMTGPWMQVSAPIWFGNSGGGAFTADEGELVGIASFMVKAPSVGFFVPSTTIRTFMEERG